MSFTFVIADSQIWVCDYDGADTFTVCMDLHEPINGAQFGIDVPGFTTTSVGLNVKAGMSISANFIALSRSLSGLGSSADAPSTS